MEISIGWLALCLDQATVPPIVIAAIRKIIIISVRHLLSLLVVIEGLLVFVNRLSGQFVVPLLTRG